MNKNNIQFCILAGGYGSRLQSITKNTPKPLLKVNKIPFIQYIIFNLIKHGVDEIIVFTGYLGDEFLNEFSHLKSKIKIKFLREPYKLGTAGPLRYFFPHLKKSFFVLNGDTFFDCNYRSIFHFTKNYYPTVFTRYELENKKRGSILLDKNNYIKSFREINLSRKCLTNSGIYSLNKNIIKKINKGEVSIEEDFFPKQISEDKLFAFQLEGKFIDIGTIGDFKKCNIFFNNLKKDCLIINILNLDKTKLLRYFEDKDKSFLLDYSLVLISSNQSSDRNKICSLLKFLNNKLIDKNLFISFFLYYNQRYLEIISRNYNDKLSSDIHLKVFMESFLINKFKIVNLD